MEGRDYLSGDGVERVEGNMFGCRLSNGKAQILKEKGTAFVYARLPQLCTSAIFKCINLNNQLVKWQC